MFEKKTLFVVGAGASYEFGLPVGTGVADQIVWKLSFREDEFGRWQAGQGDPRLLDCIRKRAGSEMSAYMDACRQIREGLPFADSIDRFIDFNRRNEAIQFCGKLALAQTILEAEGGSPLHVKPGNIYNRPDFSACKDTWLRRLISHLFGGFERNEVDRFLTNIGFLTFNYDRCIEHYLYWALLALRVSEREAAAIVESVPMVHAYGSLGPLPWQTLNGVGSVEFGYANADLPTVAGRLRTYHEGLEWNEEESERLGRVERAVADAEQLVFLGFAYHEQNLSLIRPLEAVGIKRIYGTALGFSQLDRDDIRFTLSQAFHCSMQSVFLHPMPCRTFFDEHQRVLAR